MNKTRWLFFIGLVCFIDTAGAQTPAPGATEPECLTQNQVHGGYPRYHLINGRRCWYASVRAPDRPAPRPKPTTIDVNPYGDPIWEAPQARQAATDVERRPAAAALDRTRSLRSDCEKQALKLDSQEKRAFLKQCLSAQR
jgi:hypothetical protein